MAELLATLKIDTNQFSTAVDQAVKQTKQLSNAVENISGFDDAQAGAKRLSEELKKALAVMVVNGKEGTAEFKKLEAQFKEVTAEVKKFDAALDKVGGVAQKSASQAKAGFASFGDAITGGLVGGGVAVLGSQFASLATQGFAAVIEKGGQFEQSLSAVGAIVGQSGKPLDLLGEKARELGVKFGTDATDQLSAFQTILSKVGPQVGESAPALQKFTDAANILGKAGGIDAATATNNLVDAMLQLGLVTGDANKDAENAVFLTNQLAKSAQVGAAEIPQVAQSLLQVGAAAKTLNQSTDATIAAIQTLAIGGKAGSEAGIAYRNVLGLMVKNSSEGEKAFAKLGTSTTELGKSLTDEGGPSGALKQLAKGLEGVNEPSERAAILFKAFGAENAAAAAILISNVSKVEEFQVGIKDAQKGIGSAYEQAKQQMATFQSTAKQAEATLGDIAISTFQKFQEVLGGLFKSESIDFSAIASTAKQIIGVIGEIAKPVLAFGKLFSDVLLMPTKVVINAIKTFAGVFGSIFEGSKESTVSFGDAFASVFSAIGSIFDASISVISTGVELLVTIFGSALEPLVKPFIASGNESQTLSEKIKAFADGVNVTFKQVKTYYEGLTQSIRDWKDKVVGFFTEFFNAVKSVFGAVGAIISGIASVFVSVFNTIKNAVLSVLQPIFDVVNGVKEFTSALFATQEQTTSTNKVVLQGSSIFDKLGDAINAAGGILGFFQAGLAGTASFFESFARTVSEGFELLSSGDFSGAFDSFLDAIPNATKAFKQGFEDTVSKNKATEEAKKQIEQQRKDKEVADKKKKDLDQKTLDELNALNQKNDNKNTKTKDKNRKTETKKEESELKKRLTEFKNYSDNLTVVNSEYFKAKNALELDQTKTEAQKQEELFKLELELNRKRKEELKRLFGDGVTLPFKLDKGEDPKEAQKLINDAEEKTTELITKETLRRNKEVEKLRKESLENAVKFADDISKLKVGEQLTTSIIEALGLEGVQVGSKLTEKDFAKAQETARQALFNALQELDFTLSKTQNPETRQALNEQRKKIQDDLDKLGFGIKLEAAEERDVFKEISNSFVDAFGKLSFDFNIDTSESQKAIDDVKKSIADLDKQLAKGEVTGEEYQRAIGELKKAEAEALKGIPTIADKVIKNIAPALSEVGKKGSEELGKLDELYKKNKKGIEDWGQVTAFAVTTAVGSFAKYREETDSTLKAVILSAIDALNALVPIISAQIFGLYASSPNPANTFSFGAVGAAAATLVTSAFLALVKSAVAGFETGGLVRGGEQLIRINEKGQEFVNNASSTRRNMPILEALNKGNDRRAFELMSERFGMTVSGGSQVVNLQELTAIKTELQMLRKERVLSRTKVEYGDINLKANGRDLESVIRKAQQFKNKTR